jgi:hypothetical protein
MTTPDHATARHLPVGAPPSPLGRVRACLLRSGWLALRVRRRNARVVLAQSPARFGDAAAGRVVWVAVPCSRNRRALRALPRKVCRAYGTCPGRVGAA